MPHRSIIQRFISRELGIFLIVGTLSVVVDFCVYHALIHSGTLTLDVAKACSFVAGMIFAYFANRFWTFNHLTHSARSAVPRFVLLYACTLSANVLINKSVLAVRLEIPFKMTLAFLMATGISAMLNFIGMKFFVFRQPT